MKTLHFVYAVPNPGRKNILYPLYATATILGLHPVYRNGNLNLIAWPNPIFAPYSITYFVLNTLKKYYNVKLYNWKEKINYKINEEDIVIAHLHPNFINGNWTEINKDTIGYKLLMQTKNSSSFVFAPYNHDPTQVEWMKDLFDTKKNIKYIALCGKYWTDSWDKSPLKDCLTRDRVFQINMGIDTIAYPFLKNKFSPKHKRKFLYIGRTSYPKNITALEDISSIVKNFEGGYISPGEIKGWKKIANTANLNYAFLKKLTTEYDFFLSTSEADAQSTTILEQMCIGMGVACTPESGVSYPSIIKLNKWNNDFNCNQIQKIQELDESILLEMSRMNRIIAEEKHNWNQFSESVYKFIS